MTLNEIKGAFTQILKQNANKGKGATWEDMVIFTVTPRKQISAPVGGTCVWGTGPHPKAMLASCSANTAGSRDLGHGA